MAGAGPAALTIALAGLLFLAGCGGSSSSKQATATPTFTPAAGTYTASQAVTVGDTSTGAVLYCTTDGTAPTTSSPQCGEPTTVSKSETLSAIAVAPGMDTSAVATAAYTINLPAAATPVISPNGGPVPSGQTVTITDASANASIYYTTDGNAPSVGASDTTAYTTAIPVTTAVTINAIAVGGAYSNSSIATAAFTIIPQAATPVISPGAGAIPSGQQVTITDASAGVTIYYTTNNTTPSATNGTQYSGAITVTAAETIQAIAVGSGFAPSNVAAATYTILPQAATPVISPAAGAVPSSQQITITDSSSGATIYYTTNNTTPSATNGTQYTGAITVTAAETIQAIAVATNYSPSNVATTAYTTLPQAATPVISPAAGAVPSGQQVTITYASAGVTIYYTTNNTTPSATNGTQYTGAFTVTTAETISAIAVGTSYSPSNVATAAYTIEPAAATPAISPAAGAVPSGQQVTITDSTSGGSIYYTTDNSTPSATHGTLYNASTPPTVTTQETVKAIAIASGFSPSAVASASYTVEGQALAPVISPNGGAIGSDQTVTITEASSGAQVYYTTDGSTPSATPGSTHGTLYSTPFSITGTENVQAIAGGSGFSPSGIALASFTVAAAAATPTFNPNGGAVGSDQTVSISDATSGAQIYYTTDGSTPVATPGATYGVLYTTPFSITASETIKAIAGGSGFSPSGIASASFTVAAAAATPTFNPNGGAVASGSTVTITSTTGAAIYYTIDGSAPSATPGATAGTQYTAPVLITSAETIKAIAGGVGFSPSVIGSASFTIKPSGPSISGTVSSGTTPIVGVSMQLYAAGASGYGTGATTVGSSATTASDGSFAVPMPSPCPAAPGDQLYLVATTAGTSNPNTGIALMTALGTCGNLSATGITVTVNEVTTIASAYALAGFASVDSAGGINVGSSSTNHQGLVNAFNTVGNLVDVTYNTASTPQVVSVSGAALTITPAYAAGTVPYLNSSTVPQARINTLANILAACVESAGDSSAECTTLFDNAESTGSKPALDTLQAALNIAQNPGVNVSTLFGLQTGEATPPYQTASYLITAPNDFALALTFTGAGLGVDPNSAAAAANQYVFNYAMALDSAGNVWVTAGGDASAGSTFYTNSLLAGFSNLGAPLTPATTVSGTTLNYGGFGPNVPSGQYVGINGLFEGPTIIQIDPSGNLWVANNAQSYNTGVEISAATLPLTDSSVLQSSFPDLSYSSLFTFDASGDMWLSNLFAGNPPYLADVTTSGNVINIFYPSVFPMADLTFDSANNLWVQNESSNYAPALINTSTGNPVSSYTNGIVGTLAAGAGGNIYACNNLSGFGKGNGYLVFNQSNLTAPTSTFSTSNGRCEAWLTMDGAGNLWSLDSPGSGNFVLDEVNPGSQTQLSPNSGFTGTSNAEAAAIIGEPVAQSVDGSGNLWVLNTTTGYNNPTNGNVLVEYIGIAAPTVQPLSVAVQNGTQGTKP